MANPAGSAAASNIVHKSVTAKRGDKSFIPGSYQEFGGNAKVKLKRIYDSDAPKGVIGRSSDNTTIKKYLEWEPDIPLRQGLEKTYAWIYDQYMLSHNQSTSAVVR